MLSKFHAAAWVSTLALLVAAAAAPGSATRAETAERQTCANQAYVSNSYSDTVTVIDTRTEQVLATIPVGKGPVNPTIHPDGRRVFVTNTGSGSIMEIDVATHKVVRTIPAGPNKPNGLAFMPGGKQLLVTFFQEREEAAPGSPPVDPGPRSTPIGGGRVLTLWNAETKEAMGSLRIMDLATGSMSEPITVGMGPERIALTPDGRRAYVPNLGSGTVSVVDLEARRVIATIPTGAAAPFNVTIPRSGGPVFIGNTIGNALTVIDPAKLRVMRTINMGGPNGLALSPDHSRLYVSNFHTRTIQTLDIRTLEISEPVPVETAPGFIRLTPDGTKALFVDPYGSGVSVFDVASMKVSGTIPTGKGPSVVAICGAP